jgi:hypothetical protein
VSDREPTKRRRRGQGYRAGLSPEQFDQLLRAADRLHAVFIAYRNIAADGVSDWLHAQARRDLRRRNRELVPLVAAIDRATAYDFPEIVAAAVFHRKIQALTQFSSDRRLLENEVVAMPTGRERRMWGYRRSMPCPRK